jgi:hypothetical protein
MVIRVQPDFQYSCPVLETSSIQMTEQSRIRGICTLHDESKATFQQAGPFSIENEMMEIKYTCHSNKTNHFKLSYLFFRFRILFDVVSCAEKIVNIEKLGRKKLLAYSRKLVRW